MRLIIVESPTKAKTLNRFLGKEYSVEATMGHIKDLPKSPISVDIDNGFEPEYKSVPRQTKTISNLKKAAEKADQIYLATDPDREGEAISQHVYELFTDKKSKVKNKDIKRIEFHEITQEAVEHAIANPRTVDEHLVDAQVARRVLDRLVGYKLSPLLWKKIRRGLSAGRVQSVAVRLIVEKEREIEAFKPVEYWEIGSEVKTQNSNVKDNGFYVGLAKIDGKKAEVHDKETAEKIVSDLEKASYVVSDVVRKEVTKRPYAPFTTSTMTQGGANVYGWSSKKTMTIAQKLYEQGLITYHRTDSTNIAASALDSVRGYVVETFGKQYIPDKPNFYKSKSKGAQEAHEAIRPTQVSNTKDTIDAAPDEKKLYDLIWKRFVSSQMSNAIFDQTTINVNADKYVLRVSGQIMKFDGWRKVSPTKASDDEVILPEVSQGDALDLVKVLSEQKFTQPPARYNEASLIKMLEKMGIGRPSTYAPIISTIMDRNYVERKEGRFYPTQIGITVTDFLMKYFESIVDYDFTAEMEENLDKVAEGKLKWKQEIQKFWDPFVMKLDSVEEKAERMKIETEKLGEKCPDCEKAFAEGDAARTGEKVIRTGRFGKFISCSLFPECKYTEKYVIKIEMKCPTCGEGDVIVKKTRRGRQFFGCSRYPDCDFASWKDPRQEQANDSAEAENSL